VQQVHTRTRTHVHSHTHTRAYLHKGNYRHRQTDTDTHTYRTNAANSAPEDPFRNIIRSCDLRPLLLCLPLNTILSIQNSVAHLELLFSQSSEKPRPQAFTPIHLRIGLLCLRS
jgi:hypothetical protein